MICNQSRKTAHLNLTLAQLIDHRDQYDNYPLMVVMTGKVCYYKNGEAHIDILKGRETNFVYSGGHLCGISETLNSK